MARPRTFLEKRIEMENRLYFARLRGEALGLAYSVCGACKGLGVVEETCERCGGACEISCTCFACNDEHERECPACSGDGIEDVECTLCDEAGLVLTDVEAPRTPADVATLLLFDIDEGAAA